VAQDIALSVAFRLGLEILAAGPATYDSTPIADDYVNQTSIVWSARRARGIA
jgi:hypothetical protein